MAQEIGRQEFTAGLSQQDRQEVERALSSGLGVARYGALRRADAGNQYVRRNEVNGPTYQMIMSDQHQEGDPQLHPHGVPANLGPPHIAILAGAPRALSVEQRVMHAPPESRDAEFH
jgi:hypothetical protein